MIRNPFRKAAAGQLSDNQLLDLVQRQTLRYFTDFAHPISGMARERSGGASYDCDHTVATGGTGFGIMAMIAGTERGWLTRSDALKNVGRIVGFLETADKYHGVFPHFMDGRTGKTIPFSPLDDGGDLVETSFLMMGLLAARQYFTGASPAERDVRTKIDTLWRAVEWDWHARGADDQLLWHWSSNHGFAMNLPIRGWNECLVTHVLAASSPTHPVKTDIYNKGWRGGSAYKNGKPWHGIPLQLGPDGGGPLFFSHYSFLGLDPMQLQCDATDLFTQNRNHTLINRAHCVANPHGYKGYGADCWGLTASDNDAGYDAHSPTNDKGIVSPTAALSSFPYTPKESMQALRHFYGALRNEIWGRFGFTDSFCEDRGWYSKNHLAIDQGPVVVMIENHRSGLLWKLCMSAPEIRQGLNRLGVHFVASRSRAPLLSL
jgi:hypothetical protein